jgi:hypothetical protein
VECFSNERDSGGIQDSDEWWRRCKVVINNEGVSRLGNRSMGITYSKFVITNLNWKQLWLFWFGAEVSLSRMDKSQDSHSLEELREWSWGRELGSGVTWVKCNEGVEPQHMKQKKVITHRSQKRANPQESKETLKLLESSTSKGKWRWLIVKDFLRVQGSTKHVSLREF